LEQPPTEPLGPHHDREAFACGSDLLDGFLKRQARQEQDRNVSVCWSLPDPNEHRRIRGYYTLSAYSVKLAELPEGIKKRLPKYQDMPAALLGRLAVDFHYRHQGWGEHLLLDAMSKVLMAAETLGTLVLVVDAKDEQAAAFYRHFDFIPFPSQPRRLFIPVSTIERLLG
jgi:ribosomal protein S18 acetylase RimI-like enzyme